MAAQQKQSSVLARIAAQEQAVYASVKDKEVEVRGFVDLPGGINNGIALFKGYAFGIFQSGKNKDKPYFSAFGIVVMPKVYQGIPIDGLRTKLNPEPLCDTPPDPGVKPSDTVRLTKAQHWAWVKDQVKLLNGNQPLPDKLIDLEDYLDKLIKSRIYFRFKTFQGKKQVLEKTSRGFVVKQGDTVVGGPFGTEEMARSKYKYIDSEPMVNHQWLGAIQGFVHEDDDEAQDMSHMGNGSSTRIANGVGVSNVVKDEEEVPAIKELDSPTSDGLPEPFDELTDSVDDLVARAGADEQDARDKLEAFALGAGYTQEEVTNAADWKEVANMIRNPRERDEAAETSSQLDEPQEYIPEKGQKTKYKVPNKDPKKVKEVLCDIVNVYPDTQKVDLKDPATKAQFKGVAWDVLIQE